MFDAISENFVLLTCRLFLRFPQFFTFVGGCGNVKSKFSAYNFKKIRIPQFSETRFGSFVGLFSCFYVYKQ